MTIDFRQNLKPTIGVELELFLVDNLSGDLVAGANDILEEIGSGHPNGEHPKAKTELFQSTLEVITGICQNAKEAHEDLLTTLSELEPLLNKRGLILYGGGTHPTAKVADQVVTPNERYESFVEAIQWPTRRLLICGMHTHVGVPDGDTAIAVVNELRSYLPFFLALSASSSHFEGEDSGLASIRSKLFEAMPRAGLPPKVDEWADFELFMETMKQAACITSIREVWWDVRPHPDFGTVEVRMCDATPTAREAAALGAFTQALVAMILERIESGQTETLPREWIIEENRWLATRHGLDAALIVEKTDRAQRVPCRELISKLLDQLEPYAQRLGSADELGYISEILQYGNGAQRYRRILAETKDPKAAIAAMGSQMASDSLT